MSRRARARADARPWLQQRDADDAVDVDVLLADDAPDDYLRARAWDQREAEQRQQVPQGDAR